MLYFLGFLCFLLPYTDVYTFKIETYFSFGRLKNLEFLGRLPGIVCKKLCCWNLQAGWPGAWVHMVGLHPGATGGTSWLGPWSRPGAWVQKVVLEPISAENSLKPGSTRADLALEWALSFSLQRLSGHWDGPGVGVCLVYWSIGASLEGGCMGTGLEDRLMRASLDPGAVEAGLKLRSTGDEVRGLPSPGIYCHRPIKIFIDYGIFGWETLASEQNEALWGLSRSSVKLCTEMMKVV